MLRLSILVAALATSTSAQAPVAPSVAIIPRPESLTVAAGQFTIGAKTTIVADAATAAIARRFAASLMPATGLSIPVRVGAAAITTGIVLGATHA